jgi:hypothetical protein
VDALAAGAVAVLPVTEVIEAGERAGVSLDAPGAPTALQLALEVKCAGSRAGMRSVRVAIDDPAAACDARAWLAIFLSAAPVTSVRSTVR